LALGGTAQVVVVNPSPGGGTSSAETFTIDNPISQISSLSPNTVETSDANLQGKIMGSNFVSSSSVTWNGAIQTSSYVSSTEIQFTLSADDVRTAGGAQVSVINPGPGGGSAAPRMIRINGPVVVYPSTVSVPIGGTVDFSAYLPSQPSNTSFTWAVGGSDSGAVTAAGVYTAPASIPSPAQVVVTATGQGQTGTAVVTVTAAQGLAVSPAATAIAAGATVQFTATSSGQAVTPTWQVTGPRQGVNYGSIDANGNYTAPVTPPAGSSATITATSGALAGTATVQIQFANATFKGQYAFSFSGSDNSNEFFSVAGSFTADGAGNLTNGLDDFNAFASSGVVSSAQPAAFTGAYSIGPDGRGTITIATAV